MRAVEIRGPLRYVRTNPFSRLGQVFLKGTRDAAKTLRGTHSVVLSSFYKSLRPSTARSLGRASQRAKLLNGASLFGSFSLAPLVSREKEQER